MVDEEKVFDEHAIQTQTETAEGWFWLAELDYAVLKVDSAHNLSEQKRSNASVYIQAGLERDPTDGLRWRELGGLLRVNDPHAAINAYLQSCSSGDPGYNVCWQADNLAEELGDIENAIHYYRYSRWEGALIRAAELEAQLNYQK